MDGEGVVGEGFASMNVAPHYDWLHDAEVLEIPVGPAVSIGAFVELQNNVMRIWLLNRKDLIIS